MYDRGRHLILHEALCDFVQMVFIKEDYALHEKLCVIYNIAVRIAQVHGRDVVELMALVTHQLDEDLNHDGLDAYMRDKLWGKDT